MQELSARSGAWTALFIVSSMIRADYGRWFGKLTVRGDSELTKVGNCSNVLYHGPKECKAGACTLAGLFALAMLPVAVI